MISAIYSTSGQLESFKYSTDLGMYIFMVLYQFNITQRIETYHTVCRHLQRENSHEYLSTGTEIMGMMVQWGMETYKNHPMIDMLPRQPDLPVDS